MWSGERKEFKGGKKNARHNWHRCVGVWFLGQLLKWSRRTPEFPRRGTGHLITSLSGEMEGDESLNSASPPSWSRAGRSEWMEGINTAETNRAAFVRTNRDLGEERLKWPEGTQWHRCRYIIIWRRDSNATRKLGGICSGGYFSSMAPRTDLKKGSALHIFLLLSLYVPAYKDNKDDVKQ